MHTEYTDYDTERVRQTEGSSADMPTREMAAQLTGSGRTNSTVAWGLIAVGVALLLGRLVPLQLELEAGMVLLTIGSCFLFFAFWKRIYMLIIPGCILAGLSVGVTLAAITNGVSVLWGLALGFVGIHAIGRALFRKRSNWPIYPAVPLFAVGVIVAMANLPSFLGAGLIWLPLLLIGAGLYLGWGRERVAY